MGVRRHSDGDCFQGLAIQTGIGLEYSITVDQKNIRIMLWSNHRHDLLQAQRVGGYAQGPRSAVFFKPVDRHHHMGITAIAQKNRAEVASLHLGFLQPRFAGIVDPLEFVGAHIGNLTAIGIHQSHVNKALEFAFEGQKNSIERSFIS